MLNWQMLDPQRTERAIQALLRQLYPVCSFDGAGGDGGRDAELMTADGRTVFEVKSFGRLGASQRRQVERSLRKAVASAPDMTRWVLVIPMNMTPTRPGGRSSEQAWFEDKLPTNAPGVELEWRGLDWLDGQVAGHPDIQRYIEGADSQLLARAREFDKEGVVFAGGVGDLHQRLQNLGSGIDEVSPFWTLDFSRRDGMTMSVLRAKVPDAHLVDPITITPTFSFEIEDPEAERLREQFERTLSFGGTVDLPAGYVTSLAIEASEEARLLFNDGDPLDAEFTITTDRVLLDRHIRCLYQVLDVNDRVLGQFPVFLRERTSGGRGATLFGSDAAGIVAFEVGLPRPQEVPTGDEIVTMEGARLHLDLPETLVGYDVDSLLPVIGAFAAGTAGTRIRFEMPGLGYLGGNRPLPDPQFPAAPETHQLVSDLNRMQEHTGSLLRFPANITNADAQDLRTFVRLLDGETVEHDGGLTLNLKPEAVGEFLETLKKAPESEMAGGFFYTTDGLELEVGDLTLKYGRAAFFAPHPRLTNLAELEITAAAKAPADGPVEARFEPTDAPFRWLSRQQAEEYHESGDRPTELDA